MTISAANKVLKLSSRLAAAASMVAEGTRVADVGCDHGKLSAWLVLSGRCIFAYAIDISKPSLQKAADLFVSLNVDRMTETVYADGLKSLKPGDVDEVVIAGLGCDVISRIIGDAVWLKDRNKHMVLVPGSRHAELRRYIYSEGYEIEKEQAVIDSAVCYTVMSVRYCGINREISHLFSETGMIEGNDSASAEYIKRVYMRAKRKAESLQKARICNSERSAETAELITSLEAKYKGVVSDAGR